MLYPEHMIIVTISTWHQFSSYQVDLKHPAVAVLDPTEFGEKKRKFVLTVAVPTKDCLSPWLSKTLLSILTEDESTRRTSDTRCILSLLINTARAEQPLRTRATSCASSPQAAGSLHFLMLGWGWHYCTQEELGHNHASHVVSHAL